MKGDLPMAENRKRPHRVIIHLNEKELSKLNEKVQQTGYKREAFLRLLISGYEPPLKPKKDFYDMVKQLRMIGNNLNQLCIVANKTGSIDYQKLKYALDSLNKSIVEIRRDVLLPRKAVTENGND